MKGPLYMARLRARMRVALRADGYGFRDINDALAGLDDDTAELAARMTAAKMNLSTIPAAPVGGALLDWLEQFFSGEFGKLLVEILKQLLLGLL